MKIAFYCVGGYRVSVWQITLVGLDRKIPDCLIKMTFLVKVETAIRSGIKSRCGVMGFSISDIMWGLWFSL